MSETGKKLQIAFSVTNCICNDQRVLRICKVAGNMGLDVTIIGRRKGDCCSNDNVPFRTKRFRMVFKRGFLFYKFFNIRLLFYLIFHRSDILVANDLDTLLPNFIVSRLRKIPLVFDSHEYFTGVPELGQRPFVKWIWKSIEKSILPRLDNVMTVSQSIAGQYAAEYGINAAVVRNCSGNSTHIEPYTKEKLGIDPGHLLLILQGTGINLERGAEELIDSMLLYDKFSLLIVGSGDIIPALHNRVIRTGLTGRVNFYPKVSWNEMMRFTKTADAGVSLDKCKSLNQEFSLPNKLFDYISAGIPVIAGDLPEVTRIVTDYNCGIIIPEITPAEISQAVRLLNENYDLLNILKKNARETSAVINWKSESKLVKDFYQKLITAK
jgi:glycosyltransferase involved in cell wall biosynthesis